MQRIFDVENEKDMQDLWNILPSNIKCIKKENPITYDGKLKLFQIYWHGKTEITRPVSYEDMIGCVGWFWDGEQKPARPVLSILSMYDDDGFWTVRRDCFEHFMTAKKSELKFYGE